MPNVKRADLEALRNMIEQARLIADTEPMIPGGVERLHELLATTERLANYLLSPSAAARTVATSRAIRHANGKPK